VSKYTLIFLRLYAQSLINGGEGGIRKARSDGIAKKRAFKRSFLASRNFASAPLEQSLQGEVKKAKKGAYSYASFFAAQTSLAYVLGQPK